MTMATLNDQAPVRDAACVILIDHRGDEPRLFMGRRNSEQVFLPNKWVFPGGRVDAGDHAVTRFLPPELRASLPPPLLAFGLAAVRELAEEVGLLLTTESQSTAPGNPQPQPETWTRFAAAKLMPNLQALQPTARAITPPGRVKRYDTWFFSADRKALAPQSWGDGDGELLDCDWFTLSAARDLDLPIITRFVLEDVAASLNPAAPQHAPLVPFYVQGGERFERRLIAPDAHTVSP
jgi:8-oxo-dGTP pyrophosphatase MutT (NUDIX family)